MKRLSWIHDTSSRHPNLCSNNPINKKQQTQPFYHHFVPLDHHWKKEEVLHYILEPPSSHHTGCLGTIMVHMPVVLKCTRLPFLLHDSFCMHLSIYHPWPISPTMLQPTFIQTHQNFNARGMWWHWVGCPPTLPHCCAIISLVHVHVLSPPHTPIERIMIPRVNINPLGLIS